MEKYKITPKLPIFLSKLFLARIQFHVFHLQVIGIGSFAQHIALDELYKGIVDLTDDLIETYQGKYGIVTGYKLEALQDDLSSKQVIQYIQDLHDYIDTERVALFPDSDSLNIIDEIKSLLKTGLYKLKNLQ